MKRANVSISKLKDKGDGLLWFHAKVEDLDTSFVWEDDMGVHPHRDSIHLEDSVGAKIAIEHLAFNNAKNFRERQMGKEAIYAERKVMAEEALKDVFDGTPKEVKVEDTDYMLQLRKLIKEISVVRV